MNNYPPIQTSTPNYSSASVDVFPTSTPEMVEELKSKLANKDLLVAAANNRIDHLQSQIDNMIEQLMKYVQNDEIDSDVAEDLASFFGRDLVRTAVVRIIAHIEAEVVVPVGYDLDDLSGDIEVEVSPVYHADIQIESSSYAIDVEEM